MRARLQLAAIIVTLVAVLLIGYVVLTLPSPQTIMLRLPPISPLEDDAADILIAVLYALVPLVWYRDGRDRPSKALYIYLWFTVLVPSLLFLMSNHMLGAVERHVACAMMLLAFLVAYLVYLVPAPRLAIAEPMSRYGRPLLKVFLVAVAGYALAVNTTGLTSLSFLDVYDARADLMSAITSGETSTLQVYLTNWVGTAIAPFLIAYGVFHRRLGYVLFGFASALVVFAISTFKTTFFTSVIIAIFALFMSRSGRRFPRRIGYTVWTAVALLAIASVALLLDLTVVGFSAFSWFSGFRLFLNNGFLTSAYIEYFADQGYLLYADSFLRGIVPNEHSLSFARRIGDYITNKASENSANANFLADGYVNIGYAGMLVSALQLAVVLWFIDRLAKDRDPALAACVVLPAGIVFSNLPIHTGLMSNGAGLCVLLIPLLPKLAGRAQDVRSAPDQAHHAVARHA